MALKNDPATVYFRVFQDDHFMDLNLYQYGWERCAPLKSFGPYTRNYFLFHYILSGKGVLLADDKEYTVQAGQGFLIYPGQVTTYSADQKDPWEYVWMEFDGIRVREILSLTGLTRKSPVWHAAGPEASKQLRKEILRMASSDLDTISPYLAVGHCWFFLDQLVRASQKQEDSRTNSSRKLQDFYIREALSYVEQNYQQDISVEEIAAFCRLHRGYLARIFKETIGESPQQYLQRYRMAKAEQLLKESQLSIQEISIMVGYPNSLHFSRAFKSLYGVAPREYRQQHFIKPSEPEPPTKPGA